MDDVFFTDVRCCDGFYKQNELGWGATARLFGRENREEEEGDMGCE